MGPPTATERPPSRGMGLCRLHLPHRVLDASRSYQAHEHRRGQDPTVVVEALFPVGDQETLVVGDAVDVSERVLGRQTSACAINHPVLVVEWRITVRVVVT